jgi:hypothetical protein
MQGRGGSTSPIVQALMALLAAQHAPEASSQRAILRAGAVVLEGLGGQKRHQCLDDRRRRSAAPLHRGATGTHHVP